MISYHAMLAEQRETNLEIRYALMRFLRMPGHVVFYLGLASLCVGVVLVLLVTPNVLAYMFGLGLGDQSDVIFKGGVWWQFWIGALAFALGICGVTLGPAITQPYLMTSDMPTPYTRVCHACENPFPKDKWFLLRCPKCGRIFPLGLVTFIVRLVSRFITLINLAIMLAGALFFLR